MSYSSVVEAYYDENAQNEWERLDRHPVEFAITCRALAEYLPPAPARILDCGGGPGRYTIHLAGQGYTVTLLDLSAGNLAMARGKASAAGVEVADFIHGNALDLSRFPKDYFDAVLLFGPLYHLLSAEDRARAVSQALRVLKPGGMLFAAFITLYAVFRDPIVKDYAQRYVDDTSIAEDMFRTHLNLGPGFTNAWFSHPDEVRTLLNAFPLQELTLLGSEGLCAGHEENLVKLDAAGFNYWIDLNYRLASDPYVFGAADHLLYAGKKTA